MEAPKVSKHNTTNTELIKYIHKQNCKNGLTVFKEVAMIRNWSNENQSLALEIGIGNQPKLKIDIIQGEHRVSRLTYWDPFPKRSKIA